MWLCGGHTLTHDSRSTTESSVPRECQCAVQSWDVLMLGNCSSEIQTSLGALDSFYVQGWGTARQSGEDGCWSPCGRVVPRREGAGGRVALPHPSTLRAWVSSHGHRSVPSQAGPAWPPAFRAFAMVRAKVKYARNSDFLLW